MKRLWAIFLLFFSVAVAAVELPDAGSADWTGAQDVAPGIKLKRFKYDKPRLISVYAVKIDLANPRIRLIGTPPAKEHGEFMPDYPKNKKDYKDMKIQTLRMRVWDYLQSRRDEGFDMRLAVNASPWRPWTTPYNHKFACNTGLTVYEGKIVALPTNRTVPSLVVYNDGRVDMISCKVGDKVTGIKTALSGFDFILRDGKLLANKNKSLAPRTFYGLSKDRKTLYIAVADGRQQKLSMGMNYAEGAQFMQYLGSHDAINMDGGGSTTLVTYRKGKKNLINSPSDARSVPKKLKPNSTRRVATSLGVYLVK